MGRTWKSRARGKSNPEPGTQRARVLYADSEKNADMLYASGVFVPDPFLFVQFRRKKYILISPMEYSRVNKEARVDHVYSYGEFLQAGNRKGSGSGPGMGDICQAFFRQINVGRIEVPHAFPLGLADELRERGVSVDAGRDPFFCARAVKDEREKGLIQKALRAAEHGMKVAETALKNARVTSGRRGTLTLGPDRLTSESLRCLIQQAVLEKQSVAMHTIVACGRQGFDPHQRGSGPLVAGQPIIIDIFPRSELSGYHGDMTRTFVKGKASERVREMYQAVCAAQDYAFETIRPGIQSRTVHRGIQALFRSRGFSTQEENGALVGFIHGTGHGLGLDIHEYPSIGERSCRLARGHVVTVEPGLYYPDVGGVRLEDVVWVGPERTINLTRYRRRLEIP